VNRRRLISLAALLAVVAVIAAACGGSSSSSLPSGVAVQVGEQEIDRAQVDQLLQQACAGYKSQGKTCPTAGSQEYKALQTQAVDFLVQRTEFAQKAKEMGIVISAKQIDERLSRIKKQYFAGKESRYQQQLKQQGLTEQQVRSDIGAQLTSEAIFDKITKSVKVTSADAQDYYLKNPEQYSTPQTRVVRHILVPKKATADRIYRQLEEDPKTLDKTFVALAKQYSTDPGSKAQGGKLTISKGQTVPAFDKVAFSLDTGELSEPVKTQYGWHIILPLETVKPRQTTAFEDVEKAIRDQLLQQKRNEAMQGWIADLQKEYKSKVKYAENYEPLPTQTTTSPTPTPTPTQSGG
jgi:parvulin-like peptidyl-prolyl isomerase